MSGKSGGKYRENISRIEAALKGAHKHPLIGTVPRFSMRLDGMALQQPMDSWLSIHTDMDRVYRGYNFKPQYTTEQRYTVWPNVRRRGDVAEWTYVFARVELHIALNHLDPERNDRAWHCAAWLRAEELINAISVGTRPENLPPVPTDLPRGDEQSLARYFAEQGIPPDILDLSLGRAGEPFWTFEESCRLPEEVRARNTANLARGIRHAAKLAIDAAGGRTVVLGEENKGNSLPRQARHWVLSEYPLLAALAASFALIEDAKLCQNMGVEIAAISDQTQEIYVNPRVSLTLEEAKFVMGHELLHAGLRHSARRQGRDPWFWNVACDYVINDWLIEMQLGVAPDHVGYLHDAQLRGMSAEEVYDRIVSDLRWMRKLKKTRTLNGSKPDILDGNNPAGWWQGGGVELDVFYRRALAEGLELHLGRGRGFLPAGLVEEIRAQMQPPIPWEVKLAHWLDQYFPPLEKRRTFARAHRRQSATPDIPRPAWINPDEQQASRVFGAVIDTSGSMSRSDLAKAVGAIASYAMSREVAFVRLVQCDAAPHDAGYVRPEELLDRVQIKGRGGTVLMPGIKLLEEAKDFPKDGPILLITDGYCDRLTIHRDHAILLADGGRLTQPVTGPVFRMTD